ncbi:MAG: hypothetical protein JSV92_03225 [archaeon]|nr:MAG: hypothetical protein JSV92_03225 [archaeon]
MKSHVSILFPVLLLALLVFVSGCTEADAVFSIFGLDISPEPSYTVNENLIIETEVIPQEVYEGEKTSVYFDLYNKGNTTIMGINLEITDYGELEPQGSTSMSVEEIEEGETEGWKWDFIVGENVYSQREENIRYELSYTSKSSVLYDIVAMSHGEYARLEREDRLEEEFNLNYFKTKTPVEISLSISREQPVFEDSEFYLYITPVNMGGGSVNNIEPGNLVVHYPDFLIFEGSNDFSHQEDENKLTLSRELKFYDKEAKKLTCKFKVNDVDVRDIGQFMVEASYIYEYHKTINIKIKPK